MRLLFFCCRRYAILFYFFFCSDVAWLTPQLCRTVVLGCMRCCRSSCLDLPISSNNTCICLCFFDSALYSDFSSVHPASLLLVLHLAELLVLRPAGCCDACCEVQAIQQPCTRLKSNWQRAARCFVPRNRCWCCCVLKCR